MLKVFKQWMLLIKATKHEIQSLWLSVYYNKILFLLFFYGWHWEREVVENWSPWTSNVEFIKAMENWFFVQTIDSIFDEIFEWFHRIYFSILAILISLYDFDLILHLIPISYFILRRMISIRFYAIFLQPKDVKESSNLNLNLVFTDRNLLW